MGNIENELFHTTKPENKIRPDFELEPIPEESVEGWKKIPVHECGEKLVPVGSFSEFSDCDTSAVYFGERGNSETMNFLGQPVDRSVSLITHFVREDLLHKMQTAQALLPDGYYFKFYDNYRPLEVQQALFDTQKEKFQQQHPDWDKNRLDEETQTYVSLPSPNKELGTTHPSPHSTGAVVDLTIIRLSAEGQSNLQALNRQKAKGELNYPIAEDEKTEFKEVIRWINDEAKKSGWTTEHQRIVFDNWLSEYRYSKNKARIFHTQVQELEMGTGFDHFGPEAETRYLEMLSQKQKLTEDQQRALQNRRFLYRIMKTAGFSNYPEEWWHWSFGDNMDAANTGKPFAIYGGVKMSDENKTTEWARKDVYKDSSVRSGGKELFGNALEEDPNKL